MVVSQGEIWWAGLKVPHGSEPGYKRPVVVIQGTDVNRSNIATVICIPLTSNLKWSNAPGNVTLTSKQTGLPKKSVANVSQIITLDRKALIERVGIISKKKMELIFSGIDIIFGR